MLKEGTRRDVEAILIRKAWEDPEFMETFHNDPRAAFAEQLAEIQPDAKLAANVDVQVVVETPESLFFVLPDSRPESLEEPGEISARSTREDLEEAMLWDAFADQSYRQSLLENPKAAYDSRLDATSEGARLPDHVDVKLVKENDQSMYVRIPMQPAQESSLSDEELEAVAGGAGCAAVVVASTVVVGVAIVGCVLDEAP